MLLAQAQEKLRELKELQFFGGDALNLKRWRQQFDVPGNSAKHCYRIIMTPDDPETTMPFSAVSRPTNANSYMSGVIEAVHRTDGVFEYLFITRDNFDSNTRSTTLTIEYTGKATFNVTQIG